MHHELRRFGLGALVLSLALASVQSLRAAALPVGQDDVPAPGTPAAREELKDAEAIAKAVKGGLQRHRVFNPHDIVHRDAHPKAHGCVKAHFTVNDNLPSELKKGIFSATAPYTAWIRYSNGSPSSLGKPDSKGDARGMAIKLVGVDGGKILPGDELFTQDFILSNHPVFFIRGVRDYVEFIKDKALFFSKDVLIHGSHTKNILEETAAEPAANPFQLIYYSQTPYRFGPASELKVVKYKATPVSCDGEAIEKTLPSENPNFLAEAMVNSMKKGDVCFEFGVQFQKPGMDISDSTLLWSEDDSKFLPVAKIRVRKDENDGKLDPEPRNAARVDFCENLAMSPWHGIPEHQPMSGINRVRKTVYLTISGYRRKANGVKPFEPTGRETF